MRTLCGLLLASGWLLAQQPPSFRNDLIPALTKLGCNSGQCHGSQYGKGGFKLSLLGFDVDADYEAIVKDVKGRRVNLANLTDSLILRKPTLSIPHGGGRRFAVDSATYNLLLSWLAAGAPPPRGSDPMLQSVESFPPSGTMRADEKLALKVVAKYSDGSSRDVTSSCRLEILNESVAEITPEGMVTARSGGAATVLARYMGKTAVVHLIVPYARIDPYPALTSNNYIDDLVSAKWKQLGLQPVKLSSDTQFLRRVHLDLIGVLPTEQEIRGFAADRSTDKRSKLIDKLLDRPEFVDFWTLRWGDLLRVTRNGMGDKAMWNFHRWLERNLKQDRPVDQMVREILVSRGQPNNQDVAAFYRMARTPEDTAETVAVTFMGLRLGCAKCHQHPFEKWGQEDYYGMAAFFARIDSKPDSDYTAATLRIKPTGFVRHPKTQQVVLPSVPDGDHYSYDGDPRVKLADWLTAKNNPWFARNFVNRFWGYMMGRGLVEPLDDMRDTNPPSNPELLGALARDFRDSGFSQKSLLRRIANSRVYQLDSEPAAGNPPDDTFYTFYSPKRLMAEQLLQAIDDATGVPDKFAGLPKGVRPLQLPDPEQPSYFLDTFGRSRRLVACECSRSDETNITQVLHLMNGDYIEKKLVSPSGRIAELAAKGPSEEAVSNLYYAALSRPPSAEELEKATGILKSRLTPESQRKTLEDLLWVLLNSREFLFNH
jgi:hypothetical protein